MWESTIGYIVTYTIPCANRVLCIKAKAIFYINFKRRYIAFMLYNCIFA